jgi:hypothetical protein
MSYLWPCLRRGVAWIVVLVALSVTGLAATGYRLGQHVFWRDDYSAYGGGWVKATIVRDYGSEAIEQYIIRIDGRGVEERSARIGMLRPADGTPRPPMPTTDPFRLKQLYGFHPELDSMPLPTDGAQPAAAGGGGGGAVSTGGRAPADAGLPPCTIGFVTRAGALNYDARIVAHDTAKGLYKVVYVTGFKGDEEWLPARGLKMCIGEAPAPVPQTFFVGTWDLFNGGGGVWVKKGADDHDPHVRALAAAQAPPLTLRDDGQYTWVIDSHTTVSGRWRLALTAERKYGYEKLGTTIIVLAGESGKNWLVSRDLTGTSDGRDRILIERTDLGLTYRGNRIR